MSFNTDQDIMWKEEATPEESDINTPTTDAYHFGVNAFELELPTEQQAWFASRMNAHQPNTLELGKTSAFNVITFAPVNGLFWYYFYGDAASVGGLHTVGSLDTTAHKTLTYRAEDRAGTAPTYDEIVGNYVQSVNYLHDFTKKTSYSQMTMALSGIRLETAESNAAHNQANIKYPTNDGATEKSALYKYDSNFKFLWDVTLDGNGVYSSGGDDYDAHVQNFNFTAGKIVQPTNVLNQAEVEELIPGEITNILTFRLNRGPDSSIWADFKARSKKHCHYKIYQTASEYLQLDFKDVAINRIIRPWNQKENNLSPYYQIEAEVTTVVPNIDDDVSDSFYGD